MILMIQGQRKLEGKNAICRGFSYLLIVTLFFGLEGRPSRHDKHDAGYGLPKE